MTKLTHILYLFEYVMVDLASNERKDTFVSSIEGKDTAWDDDSKVVGMQKYLCFFFLSIFRESGQVYCQKHYHFQ